MKVTFTPVEDSDNLLEVQCSSDEQIVWISVGTADDFAKTEELMVPLSQREVKVLINVLQSSLTD